MQRLAGAVLVAPLSAAFSAALPLPGFAVQPLPQSNIDKSKISVSAAASGTTAVTAATCATASNVACTTAGRAHQAGGYDHANGSNQNVRLRNVIVTTTLKQMAAGHSVSGTC